MDDIELSKIYSEFGNLPLAEGPHAKRADGVCLLEAVAWLAGEPHSDKPSCACPVIAAFGRTLNDHLPDAERQALVPYITKIVGSVSTPEVERKRAFIASDYAVRVFAPIALRAKGFTREAKKLEGLDIIQDEKTADAAWYAADAARNAAWAARNAADAAENAANAAGDAAWDAARNAAWAAGDAARAAEDAADAAGWEAVLPKALECLEDMLAAK